MDLEHYEQSGRDWVKKLYDAKGGWRIVAENGQLRLEFDEAFETRPGPDVKIYLSARPIDERSAPAIRWPTTRHSSRL